MSTRKLSFPAMVAALIPGPALILLPPLALQWLTFMCLKRRAIQAMWGNTMMKKKKKEEEEEEEEEEESQLL
jgi:membrane protein implicated in regulation of membrane protease activity